MSTTVKKGKSSKKQLAKAKALVRREAPARVASTKDHPMCRECERALGSHTYKYMQSLMHPSLHSGVRVPFLSGFHRTRTIQLRQNVTVITGTSNIGYIQFNPIDVSGNNSFATGPASDKTIGNYSIGTWAGTAIPGAAAVGTTAITGWSRSPWSAGQMSTVNLIVRCVSASLTATNTTVKLDKGGYGYMFEFPSHFGATWVESDISSYTRSRFFDSNDEANLNWTPKVDEEIHLLTSSAAPAFVNSGIAMMFIAPAGKAQTYHVEIVANYEVAGLLAGGKQGIHPNPVGAAAIAAAVGSKQQDGWVNSAEHVLTHVAGSVASNLSDMGVRLLGGLESTAKSMATSFIHI